MHRGDGFAVAMVVTSIPFSLFTMSFPIVSGERETLSWFACREIRSGLADLTRIPI